MNKVKDIIYADDIKESMFTGFREGYKPAETTYFNKLNEHWGWLRKDVTLFAGIGNHGKSTFFYQLAVLRAMKNNEKFAIFSPEQSPPDYFYNDLIHMSSGVYPAPKYMSDDDYKKHLEWVNEHFFYVFPENENPTPDYINDRFEQAIGVHRVDGVCIDPFNQLVNDWQTTGRDDRYISSFLQGCKRFANKFDIYYAIITHPKATVGTNEDGNFNCPNVFHLAGGAMWNNHADNIIFVHKPYSIMQPENTEVLIRSSKVKKQKVVGKPGDTVLRFERAKNRYFDDYGSPFEITYGAKQEKMFNDDEEKLPF